MTMLTSSYRRGRLLLVTALTLILAACGSEDSGESLAAPNPPASTTTTVAAISAPTSPTAEPSPGELPGPDEPWDLLVLAHPRYLGVDAADLYRTLIEDDLGVQVRVEQPGAIEPFAAVMLEHIRDERYPGLADLVRDAEIIVLGSFPQRSDDVAPTTPIDDAANNCAYFFLEPPAPMGPGYWDEYHAVLDELYAEIWELRAGAPTALITVDFPNVYVERQREAGIFAGCSDWFTAMSATTQERAELNGAMFAPLYEAIGGPDHQVAPLTAGLTGPTDAHPTLWFGTPNEVGSAIVAETLIEAGLDPLVGPSG